MKTLRTLEKMKKRTKMNKFLDKKIVQLYLVAWFAFSLGFSHAMEEYDVEAPLLDQHIEDENEKNKFSLDILEDLPTEIIVHIFSFIPTEDLGLNYFIRCINLTEGTPLIVAAQNIQKGFDEYIISKCKKSSSERLARSMLLFMATNRNNNFIWNEYTLLNKLIPFYKPDVTLNHPVIQKALQDCEKQISDKFELSKNNLSKAEKSRAFRSYINIHCAVLKLLSGRLYNYPYYDISEISYDCTDSEGKHTYVFDSDLNVERGCCHLALLSSVFFTVLTCYLGLLQAPWYCLLCSGGTCVGTLTTPYCLRCLIKHKNKEYEDDHYALHKILDLITKFKEKLKIMEFNSYSPQKQSEIVEISEEEDKKIITDV